MASLGLLRNAALKSVLSAINKARQFMSLYSIYNIICLFFALNYLSHSKFWRFHNDKSTNWRQLDRFRLFHNIPWQSPPVLCSWNAFKFIFESKNSLSLRVSDRNTWIKRTSNLLRFLQLLTIIIITNYIS